MNKIFLMTLIAVVSLSMTTAFATFDYLGPSNEANRNFSPLIQHQFEKQETLDFINNPSEYKAKRQKKEDIQNYREGKTDGIPESLTPTINVNSNSSGNVEFVKGDDGQIQIREIK